MAASHRVIDTPAAAGTAGTVTYGLNIQAWCVFLLAAHHVPVERCAEIIAALTGTRYLRAVLTNLRIDQPVAASIYRLTARVARTIVSAGAGE